jgi:hypothetical protein
MPDAYDILATGAIEAHWEDGPTVPDLSPEQAALVECRWREAVDASEGHLFNGTLPNVLHVERVPDRTVVVARFIEYKYFYVQHRTPGLDLGIRPVAVSGITTLDIDGVEHAIFARRAEHTTQYPGRIELVPSGTVDRACARPDGRIDVESKLLEEFTEETGLPAQCVRSVRPFALILDPQDGSHDLCCHLAITARRADIVDGLTQSDEYESPRLVARPDLPEFLRTHHADIIPTSAGIIHAYTQG